MKEPMKKFIMNQAGLTLMELILAIVLIAIVAMASFYGFQYAFVTMGSADEFSASTYENQQNFENYLSYARTSNMNIAYGKQVDPDKPAADTPVSDEIGVPDTDISLQTVTFTWDSSLFDVAEEDLNAFQSVGFSIKEENEGGTYLNKPTYTYISIYSEVQ